MDTSRHEKIEKKTAMKLSQEIVDQILITCGDVKIAIALRQEYVKKQLLSSLVLCPSRWRTEDLAHLRWLTFYNRKGCTTYDWSAERGHLAVVEWLHENRTEGCTTDAMDGAASAGHLDVVKWIHENRTEGWLHNKRNGLCCNRLPS